MGRWTEKPWAGARYVGAFAAMMALLVASVAGATSITFDTPSGSTVGGMPVSATATFLTGTDSLTITLTNLQDNPTSAVQNLSDLAFVLSGGQTAGSLISSSGLDRTIAADGTFGEATEKEFDPDVDPGIPPSS